MNNDRTPAVGEIYRHFKGKLYQIVAIATHSETKEKLVVYQALYDDFSMYARPLDMFVSETDIDKYPDSRQKYRFERIDRAELKKSLQQTTNNNIKNNLKNDIQISNVSNDENSDECNPDLLLFLEADTATEKKSVLQGMRKRLTDRLINDISVSLDVIVEEGDIDDRYRSLMNCLDTMARYECNRLR